MKAISIAMHVFMIKNIRKRWLEKHAEKHSNEEIKEYISGFLGEPHPPPEA
jgi:hypothetical protein